MNICLATNWDEKLVEGIAELNREFKDENVRVYELFGSHKSSIVGSGRPSAILPEISWSEAKEHIEQAHSAGMKFNYLLNAQCMGNREFEPEYHSEMLEYLDKIAGLGVDAVTVGMPYLIEVVRDQYPELEIALSTYLHIDSLRKAVFFDELGADRIILASEITRDFELIDKIRSAVKCDIEVLANNTCLYQCPTSIYHKSSCSHASQTTNMKYGGHYINYSIFHCNITRLSNPAEFIKSTWVRPEDTGHYVKHGVNFIKLEGRQQPTGWLVHGARAYLSRGYDGNLADLLRIVVGYLRYTPLTKEELPELEINIDNSALDGFIDYFLNGKCERDCAACNYCDMVAKKAVSFDKEIATRYIESAKNVLKHMSTSRFIQDYDTKEEFWKEHARF